MKSTLAMAALALLMSAPAFAARGHMTVHELAALTGMKPREVQLMIGPYSTNTLYLTSFIRVKREWDQAMRVHGLLVEQIVERDGELVARVRRAWEDERD